MLSEHDVAAIVTLIGALSGAVAAIIKAIGWYQRQHALEMKQAIAALLQPIQLEIHALRQDHQRLQRWAVNHEHHDEQRFQELGEQFEDMLEILEGDPDLYYDRRPRRRRRPRYESWPRDHFARAA